VLAVLAALTLALLAWLLPPVGTETPPRLDESHSGRRELAAVAVSNALCFLGQFTVYTFISVILLAAGAPPSYIGPLLLICAACGLVGLWYTGRTLDRNPRRTAIVILGTVIAAVLALGVSFPTLVLVVLTMAVWNGAFGGVPSLGKAVTKPAPSVIVAVRFLPANPGLSSS